MADQPPPIAAAQQEPPEITDTEEDEAPTPEPEPGAPPPPRGAVVDEAPMVNLQTKGVDSQLDEKGKEFIEYTFGLYIGDDRVYTITGRYSSLRDEFKDLPKMVSGCTASFPSKHVLKDTVQDNDAVRERARELREFFAALLVRALANRRAPPRAARPVLGRCAAHNSTCQAPFSPRGSPALPACRWTTTSCSAIRSRTCTPR